MTMKFKIIIILLFLSFIVYAQEPWYKDQLGTGLGNCGPACVAMGVEWATKQSVTVRQIRREIGRKIEDGSTNFIELENILKKYGINCQWTYVFSIDQLISLVYNKNQLVIICIQIENISMGSYRQQFNRKYNASGGHYIILQDVFGEYFFVQDPIRSPDRYYKMNEVWNPTNGYMEVIIIKNEK